jgi:LacI family transcriptional regulator
VTSDNRTGAALAVQHLYSVGRRRIAIVTGPLELMPAAERLAGYRYEIARLGLPANPDYQAHGDFFLSSGYEATSRLLNLPEPPDAVFAAGDEMAIGVLHAIADAGLRVPQDVAVVGFDDIEAASLVRPALTTVAQSPRALCAAAVGVLLDILDGRPVAPRILQVDLIIRASSGA